jgi:SAM-dependent methyltransferase
LSYTFLSLTIDQHADQYAREADSRGARTQYVDRIFSYIDKVQPVVVELGCGNGRDARLFLERTQKYIGYDGSKRLIEIAKKNNPLGKFEVATFDEIVIPDEIDCLVAFASLIHASPEALANIFNQASKKLSRNGIFFLDVQEGDDKEEIRNDNMGERTFYRYSPQTILGLVQNNMAVLDKQELTIRGSLVRQSGKNSLTPAWTFSTQKLMEK